jgi:hypothetical protein
MLVSRGRPRAALSRWGKPQPNQAEARLEKLARDLREGPVLKEGAGLLRESLTVVFDGRDGRSRFDCC